MQWLYPHYDHKTRFVRVDADLNDFDFGDDTDYLVSIVFKLNTYIRYICLLLISILLH